MIVPLALTDYGRCVRLSTIHHDSVFPSIVIPTPPKKGSYERPLLSLLNATDRSTSSPGAATTMLSASPPPNVLLFLRLKRRRGEVGGSVRLRGEFARLRWGLPMLAPVLDSRPLLRLSIMLSKLWPTP